MRKIGLSLCLLVLFAQKSNASELVTFDSSPDLTVSNVARLVAGSVDMSGGVADRELIDSSTQLMDLLYTQGVPTVFNVILTTDGSIPAERLGRAVAAYAALARVALVRFEGESNTFCKLFASMPSVAFVWVAGNGAHAIDPVEESACTSANILRVGPLKLDRTDLVSRSNFGPTVRIAAIGEGVTAAGQSGVLSVMDPSSAAAARVAARLVDQAACGCYRSGGELIDAFLANGTVVIDSLRDKVAGGRAVVD